MITVSLCMIVKNEEEVLGRCLGSVAHLVDEIIIMDTGSTDRTKEIAQEFGAKVFEFTWVDDFAAARNASFAKATQDYVLWLDADDVLPEEEQEKFLQLKKTLDHSVDSVTMLYYLAFDEYGKVSFSLRRNRMVKRAKSFKWKGPVHEYLEVYGKTFHSEVAVVHKGKGSSGDRNLKIYEARLERGDEFTPRDLYYYGNELVDHGRYEDAALFYERFLAEGGGWIEDNLACCGKLADCYHHLSQKDKEIASVLRSLSYDSPRAEFCCRLGYHFLEAGDYLTAIFWYRLGAQIKPKENQLGFENAAYFTWLPHLQLCVCYSRLGAYKLAYLHNEVALHYRPEDPATLSNKTLLEALILPKE